MNLYQLRGIFCLILSCCMLHAADADRKIAVAEVESKRHNQEFLLHPREVRNVGDVYYALCMPTFGITDEGRVHVSDISGEYSNDVESRECSSKINSFSLQQLLSRGVYSHNFSQGLHNNIYVIGIKNSEKLDEFGRGLAYDIEHGKEIGYFPALHDHAVHSHPLCVSDDGTTIVAWSQVNQMPLYTSFLGSTFLLNIPEKGRFSTIDDLQVDASCSVVAAMGAVSNSVKHIYLWRVAKNEENARFGGKELWSTITIQDAVSSNFLLSRNGKHIVIFTCQNTKQQGVISTFIELYDVYNVRRLEQCHVPRDVPYIGYSWSHGSWLTYNHQDEPYLVRMGQNSERTKIRLESLAILTGKIQTLYQQSIGDKIVSQKHSPDGNHILLEERNGWPWDKNSSRALAFVLFPDKSRSPQKSAPVVSGSDSPAHGARIRKERRV